MIDRLTVFGDLSDLASKFGAKNEEVFQPRYNAFPTLQLPVILSRINDLVIKKLYWGATPIMASKKPLSKRLFCTHINDLKTKSIHRNALLQRCILPVNGLLALKPIGKKKVVPTYLFPSHGGFWLIPCIYDSNEDFKGRAFQSFNIIFDESDDSLVEISESLPLILDASSAKNWLQSNKEKDALITEMKTLSATTTAQYPISPNILNNEINVPSLLDRCNPTDQFGNYTLFDF